MFTKLKQKTLKDSKPKPTVQKNGEKNGERLGKEETVDQGGGDGETVSVVEGACLAENDAKDLIHEQIIEEREDKTEMLESSERVAESPSAVNVSDKEVESTNQGQANETISLANSNSLIPLTIPAKESGISATPTSPLLRDMVKEGEGQQTPGQLSSMLSIFKKTWQGSESKENSPSTTEPCTPVAATKTPGSVMDNAALKKASKEELIASIKKISQISYRYKSRFSELMKVNQDLKADKEAQMNSFLDVERQLKRKLSELQEVRKLDAQAKQHLEDSYRAILEEEKEKLSVLQMQIKLLKEQPITPQNVTVTSPVATVDEVTQLRSKVSSLESTLVKYKSALKRAKEKVLELQAEKVHNAESTASEPPIPSSVEAVTPLSHAPTASGPGSSPTSNEAVEAKLKSFAEKHGEVVSQLKGQIKQLQDSLDMAHANVAEARDELERRKEEEENKEIREKKERESEREKWDKEIEKRLSEVSLRVMDEKEAALSELMQSHQLQVRTLEEKEERTLTSLHTRQRELEEKLKESMTSKRQDALEELKTEHMQKLEELRTEHAQLVEQLRCEHAQKSDVFAQREKELLNREEMLKTEHAQKDVAMRTEYAQGEEKSRSEYVQREEKLMALFSQKEEALMEKEEKLKVEYSQKEELLKIERAQSEEKINEEYIHKEEALSRKEEALSRKEEALSRKEEALKKRVRELKTSLTQSEEKLKAEWEVKLKKEHSQMVENLMAEHAHKEEKLKAEFVQKDELLKATSEEALQEKEEKLETGFALMEQELKSEHAQMVEKLKTEYSQREEVIIKKLKTNVAQKMEKLKLEHFQREEKLKKEMEEVLQERAKLIKEESENLKIEHCQKEEQLRTECEQLQNKLQQQAGSHQVQLEDFQKEREKIDSEQKACLMEGAAQLQSVKDHCTEIEQVKLRLESDLACKLKETASLEDSKDGELCALKVKLEAAERETVNLTSYLEEVQKENEAAMRLLKEKLHALSSGKDEEVSQVVQELREGLVEAQTNSHQFQQALGHLQGDHTHLDKSHTQLQKEHTELRNENKLLTTEKDSLQSNKQKMERTLAALEESHAHLQGVYSQLTAKHQQLQLESDKLLCTKEEQENALNALRRDHQDLKTTLDTMRQDCTRLQEEHVLDMAAIKCQEEGLETVVASMKREMEEKEEVRRDEKMKEAGKKKELEGEVKSCKVNIAAMEERHRTELVLQREEGEMEGRKAEKELGTARVQSLEHALKLKESEFEEQTSRLHAIEMDKKDELASIKIQHDKTIEDVKEEHALSLHAAEEKWTGSLSELREGLVRKEVLWQQATEKRMKEVSVEWERKVNKMAVRGREMEEEKEEVERERLTKEDDNKYKFDTLEQQLISANTKVESLGASAAAMEMTLREKEASLGEALSKLSEAEKSLEANMLDIKHKAENMLASMKKQFTVQLEKKEETQAEERKKMEEELVVLFKERNILKEEVGVVKERNKVLADEGVKLKERLSQESELVQVHREKLGQMEREVVALRVSIVGLEGEVKEREEEMETIQVRLHEGEEERDHLAKDNEREMVEKAATKEREKEEEMARKTAEVLAEKSRLEEKCVCLGDKVSMLEEAEVKRRRESVRGVARIEEEWKTRLEEMLTSVNAEREKLLQEHQTILKSESSQRQRAEEKVKMLEVLCAQLAETKEARERKLDESGREMENLSSGVVERGKEMRELLREEERNKECVRNLQEELLTVKRELEKEKTGGKRLKTSHDAEMQHLQRKWIESGIRIQELEKTLRQQIVEIDRLEGTARENIRDLKTTESWRALTTPTKNTPIRSPLPDTPSKDIVLASEPHGEEFEYFKNVLFEYMMGRQTQQLPKVIAALARFSDNQKNQLDIRMAYH